MFEASIRILCRHLAKSSPWCLMCLQGTGWLSMLFNLFCQGLPVSRAKGGKETSLIALKHVCVFLQRHQDFYDSLFTVCSNSPRSLMHLCRCAIRAILSERCHRGVPLLSIPPSMKKYLLLEPEGIIYWAAAVRALASAFPDPRASAGCWRYRQNPDAALHFCTVAGQPEAGLGFTGSPRSCCLSLHWGIAAAGCGSHWERQSWKGAPLQKNTGTHTFMLCSA